MESIHFPGHKANSSKLHRKSSVSGFRVQELGIIGVRFAEERLASLPSKNDGLGVRIRRKRVRAAFTYAPDAVDLSSCDPNFSVRSKSSLVPGVKAFVEDWIGEHNGRGDRRLVVFEDVVQTRRETAEDAEAPRYFGETPIWIGPDPATSFNRPEQYLSIGYQREVGFLVEVDSGREFPMELDEVDISDLADGAIAALVWAWDDEGIIVAEF